VDALMRRERLTRQENELIEDAVNNQGDVSLILEEISKIISRISNELGIVITPYLSHAIFDRLELIRLSGQKVLVVIHVISRAERTLILQVESALEDVDLKDTAEVLNQRLNGLTLQEINESIHDRLRDASRTNHDILIKVLEASHRIFDYSQSVKLHTSGTQMLINQPEFSDKKILKRFFSVIEDRNRLSSIFQNDLVPFKVVIGREHQDDELKPFSVVVASYRMGDDEGTIGVIGPKRMRYSKVLPLVEQMAKTMSTNLSS
jgi:heat-inducible transcriptional repressor